MTMPTDDADTPTTDRSWHAMTPREALAAVETDEHGLSTRDVDHRLQRFGHNRLPPPKTRGPLARFLSQFNNLLIQVLIGASIVTALLGHWVDTYVILLVVLVNAIIGFIQEGKAEKALEAIRHMLSPNAMVLRDDRRISVPAEDLVPGDVVLLEAGDKVPADLRLLQVKNLQVQEAALTGESVPVQKQVDAVASDAPLGDRFAMAYSGTLVTAGRGSGVVVETGGHTQLGKISALLADVQQITTPLLHAMNIFARWLTMAILGLGVLVFTFGIWVRGVGAAEMFMAAVALSVAAIPEGLPTILTVTLAIGVQRMASRNAIIRRLPAVETLGSVSIVCSDKTGTLTRNEMTVRAIAADAHIYEVGGVGYDPHGDFMLDGHEIAVEDEPLLMQAVHAMALCNDAVLREQEGQWIVDGDPMEGALLTAATKAGLDPVLEAKRIPRVDVIPFEAEHRFMATLHHDHEGHAFIYVKGAPERLLEMCSRERTRDGDRPLDKTKWLERVRALASRGQRVLAVAMRDTRVEHRELNFGDVEDELVLLGLFGLIDPPREEAIAAVNECQQAGIRVKMITGDHAETAKAIARQIHLRNHAEVMAGKDLDGLDDTGLRRVAADVDVFARTTPEHKLRLVKALQADGYVVAMTGDGVNDAPALKQADVGVAMGRKGTETAKEASEMVLADDNFASIAAAVREGRTVYDNLKKAIMFLLPINGGESGSIIAAILMGYTLPITPVQVLWVNMVSSVGLAMALAFEPAERDVMSRPPRPPREPILSPFLLWRILLVSVLFLAGIFGVYLWATSAGYSIDEARTYAVNTLVVMEVFYLFSVRSLRTRSLTLTGLFGTRAIMVAALVVTALQVMFTYAPFMQHFFGSRPMGIVEGTFILLIGVALFAILELEKLLRMALERRRGPASRREDL